ncbi:Ubiquitin-like protein 3 [Lobosporangium transversale]|uniref:Ubiquitin-related domain-containing protein n=1 Tax=Lobosporangium transversale TaxID=64571 RepID=A0A1Y2GDT3_9FUNG|nr:ubiquitin-related domain-containing protein [Lobosporangium transversale]KAF9896065.1 Ubiquitin-like protein 3 [Lobosporangium transversale]ORZ08023.1 ubiquitin-related domain-containing protein [Lobosporangium transversale]|eukprot:XP_021878257.1 ubiquitin-related domain-containing protein [Lobosporangium transversale]
MADTHTSVASTIPPGGTIDADTVALTLLLVSGSRSTFMFRGGDTIETVKNKVYENWPKEWQEEKPASPQSLKILYLGKFLADNSTLESNKIQPGATTIVHLTIKALEQELHGHSKLDPDAKCKFCLIL